MYSRRLASGTRQPSGTPLKNTFKLVRNSQNCPVDISESKQQNCDQI